MRRSLLIPLLLLACAPPEYRLGAKDGIPNVAGSTEVTLDTFVCGDPIQAGDTQVTTRKVTGGCELSFDKDVQVLKASDYENLPALKGATNLLQAVELTITTLSFTDTETNTALDTQTRITSVDLSINGQVVADKAALASLPKTVKLSGAALQSVKSKVDNRQPASVTATCVAVLPDDPKPPKKMKIDYDIQPTLVLGTGEIKLPQ
jgi:hypothetical protein